MLRIKKVLQLSSQNSKDQQCTSLKRGSVSTEEGRKPNKPSDPISHNLGHSDEFHIQSNSACTCTELDRNKSIISNKLPNSGAFFIGTQAAAASIPAPFLFYTNPSWNTGGPQQKEKHSSILFLITKTVGMNQKLAGSTVHSVPGVPHCQLECFGKPPLLLPPCNTTQQYSMSSFHCNTLACERHANSAKWPNTQWHFLKRDSNKNNSRVGFTCLGSENWRGPRIFHLLCKAPEGKGRSSRPSASIWVEVRNVSVKEVLYCVQWDVRE